MIPEGWKHVTISEIASIRSGSTPSRLEIERYFLGGTHFWVKTMDLNNGEITTTNEKITDLAIQETSCPLLPEGTVLVAMYGGYNQIGRTGILRVEASINQAISALMVDRSLCLPEYLLNWLNANVAGWRKFAASSRKDPNITRSDVEGFPIPLPPLPEQRAIAAILSTWDEAITLTERLIAALRQRKQALMQMLLTGEVRFPGFITMQKQQHTEFAEVPADWIVSRFGDIFSMRSGSTPSRTRPDFYDGDILWVTSGELDYNVVLDTAEKITRDAVKDSNLKLFPAGTFMLAITGLEAAGTRACYALWISWFRTAHDGLILAKHSALKAIPLAIFINIHSVKRYFDLS